LPKDLPDNLLVMKRDLWLFQDISLPRLSGKLAYKALEVVKVKQTNNENVMG
jgi:hypothetical protein